MSAFVAGQLDLPTSDGAGVGDSALVVEGWTLFDSGIANRIDLKIDGATLGPLRRGRERFDVANAFPVEESPEARSAGFGGVVPIDDAWRGRRVSLEVVAHGREGETWSDSVRIQIPAAPERPTLVRSALNHVAERTDGCPRVMVFTHSLHLGGGQLYAQELVQRLVNSGTEVLVVSPSDGTLRDEWEGLGATVHLTRGYQVDAEHYEGCVADLRSNIRTFSPDLVIVNTLGPFAAVDAALRDGVAVAWAMHESFDLDQFVHLNWNTLHPAVRERFEDALAGALTVFEASSTLEPFRTYTSETRTLLMPYGVETARTEAYRCEHTRDSVRAKLGYGPEDILILSMGVFEHRT